MRFHSQQAAYEKAQYEAEHDGMTGLLNKEAGYKRMRKYFDRMDSHDEAMLIFVDIDDFKTINDTYGTHSRRFLDPRGRIPTSAHLPAR